MKPLIYKITNPKGKIYIGQSINYQARIKNYKRIDCKSQKKLYNSLKKYGFELHKFEIILNCKESDLNNLERHYQDLYSSTSKNGLNIRLTKSTDRCGSFSEESKEKMSLAKKGKKRSPKDCKAISEAMKIVSKNRDLTYYDNFSKSNIGRIHSKEHKIKNSESKKGNTFTKGSKISEQTKIKISNSKKGIKDSDLTKERERISAKKAWLKRKKNE